eukprot:354237-Chlamydomonas_euryale.AAC.11
MPPKVSGVLELSQMLQRQCHVRGGADPAAAAAAADANAAVAPPTTVIDLASSSDAASGGERGARGSGRAGSGMGSGESGDVDAVGIRSLLSRRGGRTGDAPGSGPQHQQHQQLPNLERLPNQQPPHQQRLPHQQLPHQQRLLLPGVGGQTATLTLVPPRRRRRSSSRRESSSGSSNGGDEEGADVAGRFDDINTLDADAISDGWDVATAVPDQLLRQQEQQERQQGQQSKPHRTPAATQPQPQQPKPRQQLQPRPKASTHAGFARRRAALSRQLYEEWNALVFEGKLPTHLLVVWNPRLLSTAGQVVDDGSANAIKRSSDE